MDDKKTSQTDTIKDGTYELDLDENNPNDLDEAIEEAVAAVEGGSRDGKRSRARDGKVSIEIVDDEDTDSDGTAENDEVEADLRREIARLEEENADLRERMARTLADYDNFRKRNERERSTTRTFAVSEVVGDFLGVIDNLERACTASGTVGDLKQGVEMILRMFADTLRRHQVEKIDAVGQPFDPSLHEAVAKKEDPNVEVPTVSAELQSGYMLKDRLLRPAMVNVSMPVSSSGETGE